MTRARYAALALGALLASPAHAVDVPRPPAPPDRVDVVEPHRFSVVTQGLVGAIGGALIITSVALVSDSYNRYGVQVSGADGASCRPCSTGQLAGLRAEYGLGFAFLGVGVGMLVATGVLAKLDWDYRHDHTRVSKVQLTPTGLRF